MSARRRQGKGNRQTATSESAANSYFEVVCPDGHSLRGLRTSAYQALRCPECGNGVFVLPRSPLPEPPRRTGKGVRQAAVPARGSAAPVDASDDAPIDYSDAPVQVRGRSEPLEIVWADDPPAAIEGARINDQEIPEEYRKPQAPREVRPRVVARPVAGDEAEAAAAEGSRPARRPRPEPSAGSPGGETEPAAPGVRRRRRPRVQSPVASEPSEATEERPRRRGRPVGWVILAVTVLAASTFAYRAWQTRREALPALADEGWTEGRAAFEIGEFDSAKQKLARAVEALEQLGGRDERLPEARQLAKEAALLADRLNMTLEELLDEAVRQQSPEQWASRFETLYQGRSVIIDTTIESAPAAGAEPGAYPLSYRVLIGRGPKASRVGRIDLTGFRLFADQSLNPGDPVLFGARLAGVELDGRDWRIRLEPESGVTITQFKPLQLAEWDPAQSSRTVSEQPRLDAPLQ